VAQDVHQRGGEATHMLRRHHVRASSHTCPLAAAGSLKVNEGGSRVAHTQMGGTPQNCRRVCTEAHRKH
jgi:hypothetical protein